MLNDDKPKLWDFGRVVRRGADEESLVVLVGMIDGIRCQGPWSFRKLNKVLDKCHNEIEWQDLCRAET